MLLTRLNSKLVRKTITLFLFVTIILHLFAAKALQSDMDFVYLSYGLGD